MTEYEKLINSAMSHVNLEKVKKVYDMIISEEMNASEFGALTGYILKTMPPLEAASFSHGVAVLEKSIKERVDPSYMSELNRTNAILDKKFGAA